jgi:hypothetical protein
VNVLFFEGSILEGGNLRRVVMIRNLILLSLICLVAFLSIGCDVVRDMIVLEGSGNIETIEEEWIGFNRVEASHSFDIDIKQGDEYRIEIRVDEEFVDYLEITKRGNTLDLDLKEEFSYRFVDGVLEASITMPELVLVRLSGASHAHVEGFDSKEQFTAELSGSTTLTGNMGAGNIFMDLSGSSDLSGDYTSRDADLKASGASHIMLSGSGKDVRIDASGNSTVDLQDFTSEDATVDVSGASKVVLNASGTVDVSASGASELRQVGEGKFGNIDSSGASSVDRG